MRVAIIALLHESNTFIDGVTTRQHFEQDLISKGEEIRDKLALAEHEVGGFFEVLAEEGVEAVPVFAARAYPYGVIAADAFEGLVEELLAALREAGPIDGVLAAPHGATVAENHPDADGWWLERVREEIGPETPLIATLDLHANLSAAMVQATDALLSYRTNPHLDQRETGRRAARLMVRTVRGEVVPTQAAVFPPMAINIQCQNTSKPPMCDYYDWAALLEAEEAVLSQSLLLGFPYADVAEMGTAIVVVTDGDPALAARLAHSLGEDLWNRRHAFAPALVAPRHAVNSVLETLDRVLLLDMGDNVGGGSPGHGTILLEELQKRSIAPSFVCLYDPESVRKAEAAGADTWTQLSLGGAPNDRLHGDPVEALCRVVSLHSGQFRETAARHGGFCEFDQGPTAVVVTDRGVTVILTSRRMPPFSLEQLYSCGVDPRWFRVIVAKGVIAPLAAYASVVDRVIHVNTPGVTCADMTQLPFHLRRRPMFPFENPTTWVPQAVAGHSQGIPLQGGIGGDTGPVLLSRPQTLLSAR